MTPLPSNHVSSPNLQEVIRNPLGQQDGLTPARGRIKLRVGVLKALIHLHHGGLVTALIAVVGCAEYRDHIVVVGRLVPFQDKLMRPSDHFKPVCVVKLLRDIGPEIVACASEGNYPAALLLRVGPEQVAHRAVDRRLLEPVNLADVVQRIDCGRKPSVQREYLVFDKGGQRQEIEGVREVLPRVDVAVFPEALVVESVGLGDLSALVVAPEDGDTGWVSNF